MIMEKKTIRQQLLGKLHILLKQSGAYEYRRDIYSGYGVTTAADLTEWQLKDLVNRLETEIANRKENHLKMHRRKVATLLTEIGVYYVEKGETDRVAWERANQFLKRPKIAGNVFYRLTVNDLIALERKLIAMKNKGYYYDRERAETDQVVTDAINDCQDSKYIN